MALFHINYNPKDGEIHSYSENDNIAEHHCPEGLLTLTFPGPVPIFQMMDGNHMVKIKVVDGKLAYKDPQALPQPIQNPPNAAVK